MDYKLEEAYGLKSLIENLFGNRVWLDIKHSTSVNTWKKYAIRILAAIECSARTTVQIADSEWHQELSSIIDYGKSRIRASKSTESTFAALAATLGEVSFFQLGKVPENSRRKQVPFRHPANWKLDQFRSVQYVQGSSQKQLKAAHNKQRKRSATPPLR